MAGPTPAACPGAPAAAAPGAPQVPDPQAPAGTVAATIPATGSPVTAAAEDGSVWVGDHTSALVYRIDPATNAVKQIDPDPDHRFDHGGPLLPGLGGPWYGPFLSGTDTRAWVHIDAATNAASTPTDLQDALAKLGSNGATGITETADGVWGAAADAGSIDIVEFDRQDGHELRRVTIAGPAEPSHAPRILVSAFESIWETVDGDQVIERIDPSTGTVTAAVALPVSPVGMVAGADALYLATADASVIRVDPATDCVTALRFLGGAATDPATGGGDLIAVAAGTTSVLAAYDRGGLAVMDPTTLAIRKAFRVDTQDFQGALATTTDGTVWYPTFGNDTVLRIKP
ncbi:MAG TPA: hypothetical protein VF323_12535 [Candidatus Limnocylindrales bacterium]